MKVGDRVRNFVQPFTKLEKMTTAKYKAPRLIQAYHPTFNIELGRYVKPLEQTIKARHKQFCSGNYLKVGATFAKFARKWRYVTDGDHSTYDAHITKEMLILTHQFILACYNKPMHRKDLRKLFRKSLKAVCRDRNGNKWKFQGTRFSGSVDTSLGNTAIGIAIIRECMEQMGIECDVLENGDDFRIFTNEPIDITKLTTLLRKFNMETKMLPSTTNRQTNDFCRTKYTINQNGRHVMMFDPKRALDIFGMTYKPLFTWQHYLIEVLLAYAMINQHSTTGYYYWTLYTKILKVKSRYTYLKRLPTTWQKTKDYAFKHLDKPLERTLNREKQTLLEHPMTNGWFTNSEIAAYPQDVPLFPLRMKTLEHKLMAMILAPPIKMTATEDPLWNRGTLAVSHDSKEVKMY